MNFLRAHNSVWITATLVIVGLGLSGTTGSLPASAAPAGPTAPSDSAAWESAQHAAQVASEAAKSEDGAQAATPDGAAAPNAEAPGGVTRKLAASSAITASSALTGADFAAGNIISDNNFFISSSPMSASSIQTFLDGQVTTCLSTSSSLPCLRSFTANASSPPVWPTETPSNAVCNPYPAAAQQSAAVIVYDASVACGLNPEVLLALIQKESGLIDSSKPTADEYAAATGYACPDSTGCSTNPTYGGFFNQVLWTAWQLKRYTNPAGTVAADFDYYPVGEMTPVAYSPSASCGSANVNIWNSATAALYYYTPYQPDAAALASLTGSGDSCSTFGNRNFWTVYNDWFGSPIANEVPETPRLAGTDRFGTAVAIANETYSGTTANVVYIATGANFPDALSAAPAAAAQGGPLLLVNPDSVPASVTSALTTLKPAHIVVVGGTSAVDASVYATLAGTPGLSSTDGITRIAGVDRYDTSRLIAKQEFQAGSGTVFLATGANFPDALSAGAAAGHSAAPVILVDGTESSIDAPTLEAIASLHATDIRIVGGTSVITSSFASSLPKGDIVTRYSGIDRYGTSADINNTLFPAASTAYVATGTAYPDALAGAAAAGHEDAPLYVTPPTCVESSTFEGLFAAPKSAITLLGGTAALTPAAAQLDAC